MHTEQKIQDKDLPNVRHLAMQEALQGATSFGNSIQGDNTGQSLLVVALQAARLKLLGPAKWKLRKTGAVRVLPGAQCNQGTKSHSTKQWAQEARCERCKFIKINMLHSKGVTTHLC
jgi:hypothetical protein